MYCISVGGLSETELRYEMPKQEQDIGQVLQALRALHPQPVSRKMLH